MKEIRVDNIEEFRSSFRKMFDACEFVFNQPVQCMSLAAFGHEPVYGRLVQIRKRVGQFGSDLYLIRKPDGSILAVENELLEPCTLDCPTHPGDSEETEYMYQNKWPETGFIIEHPKQPETEGECSLIIEDNGSARVESENCSLPIGR